MQQVPQDFTVHFFCIGAQKAGTTSLRDALSHHTQIFLPMNREAHFTDVNENYEKGLNYFYNKHYKEYAGQRLIGNINPALHIETRSIDRIWKLFGKEVKFIFILRNPIDRAYSHYLMTCRRGLETLSFQDALESEYDRINHPTNHPGYYSAEPGHFEKNHYGYRLHSTYSFMLEYLMAHIDKSYIKLILFDEFARNQLNSINDICSFLQIEPLGELKEIVHSNEAKKPRSIALSKLIHSGSPVKNILKQFLPSPTIRKRLRAYLLNKNLKTLSGEERKLPNELYNELLRDYFYDEIDKIKAITDLPVDHWKQLKSLNK